jgi:sugar phosphate isomerase/epimerase
MRPDQIAIQLWMLRGEVAADMPATLHWLAELGYAGVEFAGFADWEPSKIRAALHADGLEVVGCHVPFEALIADADRALDQVEAIGGRRVVVPGVPEAWRREPGWIDRSLAKLVALADRCAARSLRLAYHNHDFEFAALDGPPMWDRLSWAFPRGVKLELDVYWAAFAGRDPANLIETNRQVNLLHMKDLCAGPGREDLPPGEGTLNWPAIIQAADAANVEWFIVEQDNPVDPFASAARGLEFLRTLASERAAIAPRR